MTVEPCATRLVAALRALEPVDAAEDDDRLATIETLESLPRPFDQEAQPEHVTASAFVVSRHGVVLHLHRLLGIWVQPGGHVETGEEPVAAATREVREETGLIALHLEPPRLVHVNVHDGPRSHRHFDCRWLLVAQETGICPATGESPDVSWFCPSEALVRCEPGLRAGLAKALGVARALALPEVASWRA